MRPIQTLPTVLLVALALAACAQRPRTPAPAPAAGQAVPAPAPSGEGIVVAGPDGRTWIKPDATSEAYRADVDSCYSYAQAQVANDERIETDSNAAFEASPSGLGIGELRGRMDDFERRNRRGRLFSSCMQAKGYAER